MSGGNRIPLARAQSLAEEAVSLFAPYCTHTLVAGSIRREKPDVGDIELVLQPRADSDFDRFCDVLVSNGTAQKRRKANGALLAYGERYRALTWRDVPLDLFIVRPDRAHAFGVTLLIRTGPGSSDDPRWKGGANQVLVTQKAKGGVLPDDMRFEDGQLWLGDAPVSTPTESDVFHAIGMPYIKPSERSIEAYFDLSGTWQCDPQFSAQRRLFERFEDVITPDAAKAMGGTRRRVLEAEFAYLAWWYMRQAAVCADPTEAQKYLTRAANARQSAGKEVYTGAGTKSETKE